MLRFFFANWRIECKGKGRGAMRNRKQTGRAVTMPVGLAWGTAVSILGTLLGAMVTAKLIDTGMIQQNRIGYAVLVTLFTSAFAGTTVSVRKIKRQIVITCALSGLMYFLILLSATALFFGGRYEAVGVTALLVFGGSFLAALIMARPKNTDRRRKIRKGNG